MKRAEFLKRLGIGSVAVVIAPRVIGDIVTYKNKKPLVKVKPINLKDNYIEGIVTTPSPYPCLGDVCVDKKGKRWYIKNRENREPEKWSRLILAPFPIEKKIDSMGHKLRERQPVWFCDFNRKYTITHRNIRHNGS